MDVKHLRDPLFENLSDEEHKILLACAQKIEITSHVTFAEEHDTTNTFFYIIKGKVLVTKTSKTGHVHTLATRHEGEIIGETALVEDFSRPVSLTTADESTLLVFDIALIKNNQNLYNKLVISLGKRLSQRLRELKNITVETMHHRLEESKKRFLLGVFLVGAVYITDIYTLSLVFINDLKKEFSTTTFFTVSIVFVIVSYIVFLIKKFNFPLTMFGITLRDYKQHIREAIGYSIIFIAGFTLIKWIGIHTFLSKFHLKLFDPTSMIQSHAVFNLKAYFFSLIFYILFIPLQEFIVRGTLQGTFYRFLAGSETKRKWESIVASNLLFAIVHLHASVYFPFFALIPGIFWGWLYARQKTLVGVCVSHMIIGVYIIFICGLIKGIL